MLHRVNFQCHYLIYFFFNSRSGYTSSTATQPICAPIYIKEKGKRENISKWTDSHHLQCISCSTQALYTTFKFQQARHQSSTDRDDTRKYDHYFHLHMSYKDKVFRNSTKHEMRSFSTAVNRATFRSAQTCILIAQLSTSLFTPHRRVEVVGPASSSLV